MKPADLPMCLRDMRLPGEAFCADCPDHEACHQGAPCYTVRLVDLEANQ